MSSSEEPSGTEPKSRPVTLGRRQAPSSTAEQERRQKWGKLWGKMSADTSKQAIGDE